MAEKDIIVVSDLHIGDGGPRDNFSVDNKEKKFNHFLDYVEQSDTELFVLGDLFDFWQANISRVVIHRLKLLDRLAQMQAVYVVGNHDADFEHLIGTDILAFQIHAWSRTRPVQSRRHPALGSYPCHPWGHP
ncbi:MAG: metallophosphoesterase [Planctomycetota bacterium]